MIRNTGTQNGVNIFYVTGTAPYTEASVIKILTNIKKYYNCSMGSVFEISTAHLTGITLGHHCPYFSA